VISRSSVRAVALAIALLGIASGCASRTNSNSALENEDAGQRAAAPGTVGPNGTLSNGLLPEQWGDTN
jgi:hypothetical protein